MNNTSQTLNETVKFEDLTEVEQEQFHPLFIELGTHLLGRPDFPKWGTVQGFVDVLKKCPSERIALVILDELDELSDVYGTENPYRNLWENLVTVVHWKTMEREVKNRHLRLVKGGRDE